MYCIHTHGSTWAWACWFLGSYLIAQRLSIPLIIQPQSFGLLAAVSVAQCLYYSRRCSKRNAVLFVLCFAVTTAGFETGSVFALWVSIVTALRPHSY